MLKDRLRKDEREGRNKRRSEKWRIAM